MALVSFFFFFKQKTAYEIQGDWSSDVCSSDLSLFRLDVGEQRRGTEPEQTGPQPALAQLFLHEDEPVERLFRLAEQRSPSSSFMRMSQSSACFALRIPPAGLNPTAHPVRS